MAKRNTLIERRLARGLSKTQMAALVGITRQYYGMIENGLRQPSLPIVLRISGVLREDPRVLFADVMEESKRASA